MRKRRQRGTWLITTHRAYRRNVRAPNIMPRDCLLAYSLHDRAYRAAHGTPFSFAIWPAHTYLTLRGNNALAHRAPHDTCHLSCTVLSAARRDGLLTPLPTLYLIST